MLAQVYLFSKDEKMTHKELNTNMQDLLKIVSWKPRVWKVTKHIYFIRILK